MIGIETKIVRVHSTPAIVHTWAAPAASQSLQTCCCWLRGQVVAFLATNQDSASDVIYQELKRRFGNHSLVPGQLVVRRFPVGHDLAGIDPDRRFTAR